MRVAVKKWGCSASVRIPAGVLKAGRLRLDQAVDVRKENGRIIIEPIEPETYVLSELLGTIADENLHEGVDTGRGEGKAAGTPRVSAPRSYQIVLTP